MSKDFVWGKDASGNDRRVAVVPMGGDQYALAMSIIDTEGEVKPTLVTPGVAGFSAVTSGRGMFAAALDDVDASVRAVFEPIRAGTYKAVVKLHCDEVPTGNILGLTAITDVKSVGDDPTGALPTAEDLDPDLTGAADEIVEVETSDIVVEANDIVTVEIAKNEDDGASGNLVIHGIKLVLQ